ncbi:hypothetical protein HJFPF1_05204 [Paramyrothecium foliicola]|nr:hypothetical protein HJFPF1_05204 [Paramyrothecium foliicola]
MEDGILVRPITRTWRIQVQIRWELAAAVFCWTTKTMQKIASGLRHDVGPQVSRATTTSSFARDDTPSIHDDG